MTKKALLIGVDKYPAPTDDLRAAVKEMYNWQRILKAECGFDHVVCLADEKATRADVLRELRNILSGLGPEGDDVVIGCFGHGAKARGWLSDTETNNDIEHAFIAYAGETLRHGLQHAAITPSDFARVLKETKTPAGVRVAILLDFCEAARFGGIRKYDAPPPHSPRVQFIRNAVPGIPEDAAVRTFGAIKTMVADAAIADPILLAAAGPQEPANEVGAENDRRLEFSARLQAHVELSFGKDDALTYRGAIAAVTPLSAVQSPLLYGNTQLADAPFAGGFAQQIGIRSSAFSPKEELREAAELVGANVATTETLRIRVLGLIALINLPNKRPYRNRLVAPYDNFAQDEAGKHQAFIEVAERDFKAPPYGVPTTRYVRAGIQYSRWHLSQHRVTFANVADTGQPLRRSDRFNRHVPSLPVVMPTAEQQPRPDAYDRDIPPLNRYTAFYDLISGDADVVVPDDLENHRTRFTRRYTGQPTWGPEYTPITALITLPLTETYAVITIYNEMSQVESVIFVNSGATVLVGNARENDINGPGSGEGPREHFLIYYQLAPQIPLDPGLPETVQVPINACTPTTWP